MHSKHRLFLGYALEHLQSYATPCSAILSGTKEDEGKTAHGTNAKATDALDMLCWHWIAAASLLCTRTDTFCTIKKTRPSETLTSVLKRWPFSSFQPDATRDYNSIVVNPEVLYAQLRYVCIVMDSMGGVQGQAKAFGETSEEMKARFVFFFAQGLSVASKRGDEGTVLFILKILRTVFLSRDIRYLLSSQNDEQALLAQLLLIHDNSSAARGVPDRMPRGHTELEFFVADFIVSRDLCLKDILRRVRDAHTNGDQVGHGISARILHILLLSRSVCAECAFCFCCIGHIVLSADVLVPTGQSDCANPAAQALAVITECVEAYLFVPMESTFCNRFCIFCL